MLDKNYTKLPNEFINDIANLSHKAVRIYIVLRSYINESKNGDMVFPSYTTIQRVTGLQSEAVSNGIKELISSGWLEENIEKGFNRNNKYHVRDSKKEGTSEIEVLRKSKSSTSEIEVEVLRKAKTINTNVSTLKNKTDDFSFDEKEKDNPQDEDKQKIEEVRCLVESKTERKKLSGSNWYEFYKFVVKRQNKNPKENIEAFFDYLYSENYDYKKYVGYKAFYEQWTKWAKELRKQSKDYFYADCIHTTEIEEKKYVAIPKYESKQVSQ